MTETTQRVAWAEANQAYLVAEFSHVRCLLGEQCSGSAEDRVEEALAQLEAPSALDQLTNLFGLSSFERQILLL